MGWIAAETKPGKTGKQWCDRCDARATEREYLSNIWILLSYLILSFFILQYLCINSITTSYHLFLINSLFQSTKYIHTTSDFPQNCLILLLKQELTVVNVTLDFKVQKYGIILMKSLNFSLLYNLRRKWNITLLRNINPNINNIYCTYNVTPCHT